LIRKAIKKVYGLHVLELSCIMRDQVCLIQMINDD